MSSSTRRCLRAGASHRLTAGRWEVTRNIMWAWLLTIRGAAISGTILFHVAKAVLK